MHIVQLQNKISETRRTIVFNVFGKMKVNSTINKITFESKHNSYRKKSLYNSKHIVTEHCYIKNLFLNTADVAAMSLSLRDT